MRLKLISGPASEPISLSDAKLHLRVDAGDEDALISRLITAARQYVEASTGACLGSQTWELYLDRFEREIVLPRYPVQNIVEIGYTPAGGSEVPVSSGDYIVDKAGPPWRIVPAFGKTWPASTLDPISGVRVRFTAGFTAVPEWAKEAMLLLIGHWYEHREAAVVAELAGASSAPVALAVEALLAPHRLW